MFSMMRPTVGSYVVSARRCKNGCRSAAVTSAESFESAGRTLSNSSQYTSAMWLQMLLLTSLSSGLQIQNSLTRFFLCI